MTRYKSPELPPAANLAERTSSLRKSLDELESSMAKARPLATRGAALDELNEAARCELLALCDMAERSDQQGEAPDLRLSFYSGFRDAVREFCTALGSRTSEKRRTALEAMKEAIASLNAYQGTR